jgi:hypothetical protein
MYYICTGHGVNQAHQRDTRSDLPVRAQVRCAWLARHKGGSNGSRQLPYRPWTDNSSHINGHIIAPGAVP